MPASAGMFRLTRRCAPHRATRVRRKTSPRSVSPAKPPARSTLGEDLLDMAQAATIR